jgi:hypothetical protein
LELENRVLADAIRWFEEEKSHYTPDMYLKGSNDDVTPGRDVVAACAIGGIEQALWRLTGEKVSNERELAYAGTDRHSGRRPESEVFGAYWGVMFRLNAETRRRAKAGVYDEFYESYEDTPNQVHAYAVAEIQDVEDVTQIGGEERSRELMLDVFRATLQNSDPLVPA